MAKEKSRMHMNGALWGFEDESQQEDDTIAQGIMPALKPVWV